jgi:hypothetical protein
MQPTVLLERDGRPPRRMYYWWASVRSHTFLLVKDVERNSTEVLQH